MAKAVVPIANTPLLHYLLRWLKRNGVEEITINLHHLPHSIRKVVDEVRGIKVTYSYEPIILGTGGGLKKVEPLLKNGVFMMMNTDILIDINLDRVIKYHLKKGGTATMVLMPAMDDGFTKMGIDIDGRLILEETLRPMNFVGLHIFNPQIFDYITCEGYEEIYPQVYRRLLDDGRGVYGYVMNGYWQHIGSFNGYLRANMDVLDGKIWPLSGSQTIAEGVDIPPSVKIKPPLIIGEGVIIEGFSTIGPYAVIGQGVRVSKGVSIKESVVLGGVVIEEGIRVEGCIVGKGWIRRV
jgi:NDP-sugar pyrophosphorylase family protein